MPVDPLGPHRGGTPPFVSPLLRTLDRMQQRETLRPDQLTERAESVLTERFGASSRPMEAAFAHGGIGLQAAHTHYFNGFALMMSLRQGTAVALRTCEEPVSRLVFDGSDDEWVVPEDDADVPTAWPEWAGGVMEIVRRLKGGGAPVQIAVASTVPSGCLDAYMSAVGMAASRATQALFALPESTHHLLECVREVVAERSGLPLSIAYPMAAEYGRPEAFTLIDTETLEHLPLDAPSHDVLGWGLVDIHSGLLHSPSFYHDHRERAEKALGILQDRGFPQLTSYRDLEHQDLQRALAILPRRYQPVVRHLVVENRRVQKLVAATRRRDWQMLGALLLMSHASMRNDWKGTTEEIDFVVEQAEAQSLEGIHGACATGRSGCVIVAGRPFVVPPCLDRIKTSFAEQFHRTPDILLL